MYTTIRQSARLPLCYLIWLHRFQYGPQNALARGDIHRLRRIFRPLHAITHSDAAACIEVRPTGRFRDMLLLVALAKLTW